MPHGDACQGAWPYAYGLVLDGTAGVVHGLRSMLAGFELTMTVNGYPSLRDLTPHAMQRVE